MYVINLHTEKEIENKNFMITLVRGLGAKIPYLKLEENKDEYIDSFDDVL